jgi:hypothetical protein
VVHGQGVHVPSLSHVNIFNLNQSIALPKTNNLVSLSTNIFSTDIFTEVGHYHPKMFLIKNMANDRLTKVQESPLAIPSTVVT